MITAPTISHPTKLPECTVTWTWFTRSGWQTGNLPPSLWPLLWQARVWILYQSTGYHQWGERCIRGTTLSVVYVCWCVFVLKKIIKNCHILTIGARRCWTLYLYLLTTIHKMIVQLTPYVKQAFQQGVQFVDKWHVREKMWVWLCQWYKCLWLVA